MLHDWILLDVVRLRRPWYFHDDRPLALDGVDRVSDLVRDEVVHEEHLNVVSGGELLELRKDL